MEIPRLEFDYNQDELGQNYSKLGRELMTVDELQTMDRSKCIVMILGLNPFKDDKYDITAHPKYSMHANGIEDKKHWFDYPKYLNNLRKNNNNIEPDTSDVKMVINPIEQDDSKESIESIDDDSEKIDEIIESVEETIPTDEDDETDDEDIIIVEVEEESSEFQPEPEELGMNDFY